jgi:putative ABC transport system ATP-binding protein
MSEKVLIELKDVHKIYHMDHSDKVVVHALNGVSLKIYPGEFASIMGPSGSGKTTLLDILSALLRPSKGKVFIDGEDVSKMNDSELAIIRGKKIGFIFQSFNLIGNLTALENVMLPLWFAGVPFEERKERAVNLLKEVEP